MFPHTITIFNVIKNDDISYHRNVINDVFYYNENKLCEDGNGEKQSYSYHVILSDKALENWVSKQNFVGKKNTFTLRENDIIVLGEFNQINNLIDLQKSNVDYFLIKSVSEHLYGDKKLWSIEVSN